MLEEMGVGDQVRKGSHRVVNNALYGQSMWHR